MMYFLLMSCVHQLPAPKQQSMRVHVEIDGTFAEAETSLLASVALDLSVVPIERHSDDSVSYRIAIENSKTTRQGKEEDWKLVGKYVIARAFESGELLSINHLDEWGEESPYIDAFDILWFVMFPNPPNMQRKETAMSMARYPLNFSTEQRAYVQVRNTWNLDSVSQTATLSYKGAPRIKGKWRELLLSGTGEISGLVVSSLQGGVPLEHKGTVSRSFCYEGAQKEVPTTILFVHSGAKTVIFLLSSFLAAQEYLTAKKVHKILDEGLSQFSCSTLDSGLYTVDVFISRDGSGQAQSDVACLRDISALSFPAHASQMRQFRWKVVQQQKSLFIQEVQHIPQRTVIVPGIFSLNKEAWYFELSQQR